MVTYSNSFGSKLIIRSNSHKWPVVIFTAFSICLSATDGCCAFSHHGIFKTGTVDLEVALRPLSEVEEDTIPSSRGLARELTGISSIPNGRGAAALGP